MKTQVNSGEIPFRKNVGKMKQNVDNRRLTPKSANLTRYPILKIQLRENTGKGLKISETGMADMWVLVQTNKVWNIGQLDIRQLGCRVSVVQHFGSLNFLDMQDVGL